MTPTKPYFIRALYDWIVDNACTPYLLVNTADSRCVVPTQFIRDGAIVLNLAPAAVKGLELGGEFIMFSARFSGVSQEITVPIGAVRAIYAKENGRGLAFEDEAVETAEVLPDTPPTEMRSSTEPKTKSPPRLTIVK
jgi:stringent starvation protein B